MHRLLKPGLLALGFTAASAHALNVASCTAAASGVSFGTYNPSSATALAGSGTVTATCTGVGLLASWTIALDAGINNGGLFSARKMKAVSKLTYNLYTDLAHTQIWGDGTTGTGIISDSVLAFVGSAAFPHTVYGLITPLQDLPPGTYNDTITVTINY